MSANDAELGYASAAHLGELLARNELTSSELVETLLSRIDKLDRDLLRSVLFIAPDALDQAERLDKERRQGALRSPLHGIPVLVKDNIATRRLGTTAGSLALLQCPPKGDAPVVARLRAKGAVVIGKANMSEWANFRSSRSSSGWSAIGGQTQNPIDDTRTPGGSSSGSAAALAAGLTPLALGTETDGSILCPASCCGIVGFKPTHGLVSTAGVIPIAHSQDTVGPMARSIEDLTLLFDALVGPGTTDGQYARLGEVSIGVPDAPFSGYHERADELFDEAIDGLERAGATVHRGLVLPGAVELEESDDELFVLATEFKADINRYLERRVPKSSPWPRSLHELIEFNEEHRREELAGFGQDLFLRAEATVGPSDPAYRKARREIRKRARERGLDLALRDRVNVVAMLTMGPAWPIVGSREGPSKNGWSIAAVAGYPSLSLPLGKIDGLPVGMTVAGRAGDDRLVLLIAKLIERHLGFTLHPSGFS